MNFSRITDDLFIGNTPGADDYDHLRDLGVRLVINMRLEKRLAADLHCPLLKFLWLLTADTPLLVIPLCCLRRGVRAALETIQAGGKVYVHCAKGRHRGVAMGASILIAQGYDPERAMELIKARRPIADPDIFYIRNRILRFARTWQRID
jgi:dual specificity MAP kinase phosphatase